MRGDLVSDKQEARDWARGLSEVLNNQKATQAFRSFLYTKEMGSDHNLLIYIKRCDQFLVEEDPANKKKLLLQLQKEHLSPVCSCDVAAGKDVIKSVRLALKNGNICEVVPVIETSRREKTMKLNEYGYPEFQSYLRLFQ